jgi:hypothetical protein
MSNPTDKSLSELAADIQDLLEETVDLLQGTKASKTDFETRLRASHHLNGVRSPSLDVMNQYEMTSIRALLAWAANEQKAPTETIQAVTEVRFNVDNVAQLPRKDYDEVIKFLIDLRLDEMKN